MKIENDPLEIEPVMVEPTLFELDSLPKDTMGIVHQLTVFVVSANKEEFAFL